MLGPHLGPARPLKKEMCLAMVELHQGQELTSQTQSGHEVSVLDDETREGAPDAKATDGQGDSPDNVESLVAGMISSDGTLIAGCPDIATLIASNDDSTAEGKSTAGGPRDEQEKNPREFEVGHSEGAGDQPNNRYQDGIESMERDSSRDGCEPNNISHIRLQSDVSRRSDHLLQELDLNLSQLRDHLLSFANVFELDASELGRLSTASDHQSIKQSLRRVPFAL